MTIYIILSDISDADRGFLQGIITQLQRDAIYSAIDSKRCPPWDTALGGHIMIHGNYHEGGVDSRLYRRKRFGYGYFMAIW